jgi:hypothetical protein
MKKLVNGVEVDEFDDDDEPVVDDDEPVVDDDEPVDDDDDDADKPKEVDAWMADEGDQKPSDVPVSTHIRMKQKLKGRLTDSNEEVARLRAENEALRAGVQQTPKLKVTPKRPRQEDFDTILDHEEALSEYEDKMLEVRLETANTKVEIKNAQSRAKANLEKAVDSHYERASKLIQDNGIDTEVYKQSDLVVREAVESIRPGIGDFVTDQIISILGDGSEKVLFYLGRNKNALNEFKSLLTDDPTGLKASLFLGQQRERLLNTKRKTSKAPPPDDDIRGDDSPTSANTSALLKRRQAAIKKGDLQAAYNVKKQAKAAGVDVSKW